MSILAEKKVWTPEELLALPDEKDYELVNGELVERNMGVESSWVGAQLLVRIAGFVTEHRLGWVLPADTGYQCFQEDRTRVRKADVSFVRAGRFPQDRLPKGYALIPPDLAVEVVSPNDLYSEVRLKVGEYLAAEVRLVWIVDPESRTAEIWRSDGSRSLLRAEDSLDGEDVLPGFRCRLGDLLPDIDHLSGEGNPT